jgi:zinc protease
MQKKHPVLLTIFAVLFIVTSSFLGCASSASTSSSQNPAVYAGLGLPSDPVPFMRKARRGTLPSGITYYILRNDRPENRAFLTLAVDAGSVLEEDDEQGLAHFVEHMAFNGTKRFPELELDSYLQSLGMRIGADSNAYTDFDETVYRINVPTEPDAAGVKRIPSKALDIIDDWSYAVLFNSRDVDEERPIILEEKRTRLDVSSRIWQRIHPVLFQGSRYAKRDPIGLAEVIETAPAETLAHFYRKWYRPENMALIIVGDFDDEQLEAELSSYFNAPTQKTIPRPDYKLPPPKKGNLDIEILTDPELPYTAAYLYYKRQPVPERGDLASFREELIDTLISTMISERFRDEAAKPDSPSVGSWAFNARYVRDSLWYVMGTQAKTGSSESAIQVLLREKERMYRYGFTGPELDRAKDGLISTLEREAGERHESYPFVVDFTGHFLKGETVPDITWQLEAAGKLLPFISEQDINAAVKNYFSGDDLTFILTAPETERPLSKETIKRLIAASKKEKIERPQSAVFDDKLVRQAPQAGGVVRETPDSETGALTWELSNGAKIVVRQTANKNDEIVLNALARGGETSVDEADIVSAQLASTLLIESGIGGFTLQELNKKLAAKQVGFSFDTDSYTRNITGSSSVKDIKTLFELVYLTFVQPDIDPQAVRRVISRYETYLTDRDLNPEEVFSKEVTKMLSGNNPYFNPLEKTDLNKLNTDSVLAFIKQCLNPADWTFVFVGNIDIAALRSLAETYIASIPPLSSNMNKWVDARISRPKGGKKEIRMGKEDKSVVYMIWFLDEAYTEEKSAAAAALTEYLNIIFDNTIREKLGGVYSIGSRVVISAGAPQQELSAFVYFPCDPKKVTDLTAAVNAEIRKIADGTVDAATLAKAKEALKRSLETSLQNNAYIAESYANSAVVFESPFSRLNKRFVYYEAVSAQDVRSIAQKLAQAGNSLAVLYPEGE